MWEGEALVRILIKFSDKMIHQPVFAQTILECGVPMNILSAHIDHYGGEILAEIPSVSFKKVFDAFRQRGVAVERPELIDVDEKKCFSCGACISLCPVNAIAQTEECLVVFNKEKCVGSTCGVCTDACPVRAIKLIRQSNDGLTSSAK